MLCECSPQFLFVRDLGHRGAIRTLGEKSISPPIHLSGKSNTERRAIFFHRSISANLLMGGAFTTIT
jgi:hypothetical protein